MNSDSELIPNPNPTQPVLTALLQPSACRPHPEPRAQSDRPAKRPRYSADMQPHNHGSSHLSAAISSSHPPLHPDHGDDALHQHLNPTTQLSPHHSSSRSVKLQLPRPSNPPPGFDSLLKTFSDGLLSLGPQLISNHSAVEGEQPQALHPIDPNLSKITLHSNSNNLPWPLVSDIEREEIVRLLLQSLKEIGYPAAAKTLEVESGFTLDPSPEITSFRHNVLHGKWQQVDELLEREYLRYCDRSGRIGTNSQPLSPVQNNKNEIHDLSIAESLFGVDAHVLKLARFLVMQEKYLELLESRQIRKALVVLRSEVAPLVTPPSQNGISPNPKLKTSSSATVPSFNKLSFDSANGALAAWATDQDEDPGVQRLCLLSSLMMCNTAEEVREKAEWDGVSSGSRVRLLEELQELIPPQKLLPHQRLPHLLEQSKALQRLQCLYHVANPKISLLSNHTCSRSAFPTETSHILSRHSDEVWRIEWSHDGRRLASADRSQTCIIWKLKSAKTSHLNQSGSNQNSPRLRKAPRHSGTSGGKSTPRRPHISSHHEEELDFEIDLVLDRHPAGIACIAWSPDDSVLLTGSDCKITMWNTRTGDCIATMVKHSYEVGALSWLPDGRSFVSGGQDTNVLFWDLNGQNTYKWQVAPTRITDLAVSPDGKLLVVVGIATLDPLHSGEQVQDHGNLANGNDSTFSHQDGRTNEAGSTENNKQGRIHIFNIPEKRQIAMIPLVPLLTCVSISDDSKYALINQSPNQVLLYSLEDHKLIRRYVGQKQGKFIIKSCFGGLHRNFILSGSEDGKIYVWHMETGALIEVLSGHGESIVNAVAWNSNHPPLFASASDDHTVRIWQAADPRRSSPTHIVTQIAEDKENSSNSSSSGNHNTNSQNHEHSHLLIDPNDDDDDDDNEQELPF